MVIGLVSCIVWRFAFRLRFDALSDLHEIIPAFLLSMLAYLVISLLTRRNAPDSKHLTMVFGEAAR